MEDSHSWHLYEAKRILFPWSFFILSQFFTENLAAYICMGAFPNSRRICFWTPSIWFSIGLDFGNFMQPQKSLAQSIMGFINVSTNESVVNTC